MKFIDLSHTIEEGLITYKGLPAPIICDFWTREVSKAWFDDGTSFQIGKIEMVANTGTYIDTPFHRFDQGADLSEIALEQICRLESILITAPYSEQLAIGRSFFEGKELRNKAVIIYTGWDMHWKTETYYSNSPFLTADAAAYLVEQKVKLVGIDSHNIDNTGEKCRPVHTQLLGNSILIVEHLCNLQSVNQNQFFFTAVPPKIKGMGTFSVRAYAELE
ncbi:MAG: cyclase family protein [Saprospiraceae bacterium]